MTFHFRSGNFRRVPSCRGDIVTSRPDLEPLGTYEHRHSIVCPVSPKQLWCSKRLRQRQVPTGPRDGTSVRTGGEPSGRPTTTSPIPSVSTSMFSSTMKTNALLLALAYLGCANHLPTDAEVAFDTDETSDVPVEFVDSCEVVNDSQCSLDCMAVYSSSEQIDTPCTVDGVFFGCVPAIRTGFWNRRGESEPLHWGRCDVLKSDSKQRLYCFEGQYALYWYFKNRNLWCEGGCNASPDASPCEP